MALEGAPEVEGPEDEAPSANLGAVKGLANLALALADTLVDLALAVLAEADLAVGCCDPDGVSSFLDLAGALQTERNMLVSKTWYLLKIQ